MSGTPSGKTAGFEISLPALIGGALSLTAALAWNEAARAGIRAIFPHPTSRSFLAAILYAVVVTLLVVLIFLGLRSASRAINGGSLAGSFQGRWCRPARPGGL
jgi:uncharacterized BrkB/YihY/UPF0761 family membrane protein